MRLSMVFLSCLMFLFSSLGFASSDAQSSVNDDRAQVTASSCAQGSTAIHDFVANDGEINHSCSCEGTQACSVSCAFDKSAKCGKDLYGYCSCSCQ